MFPWLVSRLLRELILVRVRPLFDETWLESSWAIGHFKSVNLIEHREAIIAEVVDEAQRDLHLRRQNVLARAGEADLAWQKTG